MIKINQAIIVEGKYDKIKLSSFLDTIIIATDGFRIFKDSYKINLIKQLSLKDKIIILTDSDVAGFKIRNFLSTIINTDRIINIYIPNIVGKEKRKPMPSKEGFLGVEGVDKSVIVDIFRKYGIFNTSKDEDKEIVVDEITVMDFFNEGLIGSKNSSKKRQKLKERLALPIYLSTKSLIKVVNNLMSRGISIVNSSRHGVLALRQKQVTNNARQVNPQTPSGSRRSKT